MNKSELKLFKSILNELIMIRCMQEEIWLNQDNVKKENMNLESIYERTKDELMDYKLK